jgi:hypothetical protein
LAPDVVEVQVEMRGLEEMSSMEECRCKTCVSTFPREIDFERHKKWWKHREFPPEGVKIEMRRISNQYSAAAEYGFRLLVNYNNESFNT